MLLLRLIPLLCCFAIAQADLSTQRTCYGWDGQPNLESPLCQPNATTSNCCHAGDYCYSGGFCHKSDTASSDNGIWFIGLCTNIFFEGPECAAQLQCHQRNVSGNGLLQCSDDTFCCYGSKGCNCEDANQVFTLSTGTVITSLPVSTAASTMTTTTVTMTSSLLTSAASTTTAATSSSSPSSSSSASSVQQTTSPAPSESVSPSHFLDSSGKTGVSIGVVSAAVLVGLAVLYFRRRQRWTHVLQQKDLTGLPEIKEPDQETGGGAAGISPHTSTKDNAVGVWHAELPDTARHELPLSTPRSEMPLNTPLAGLRRERLWESFTMSTPRR